MYWDIGVAVGWLFMFTSMFLLTFKKGRSILAKIAEDSILEDMLLGKWGYSKNTGFIGCIGIGAFICIAFGLYFLLCIILSFIIIVIWPLLLFSTIIGIILNKKRKNNFNN
tara:strand:- start:6736 stop:7068 length:333 start_codon:yes stop_codon:yes gene_type:complete